MTALFLLFSGCGWSEERWYAEGLPALCDARAACAGAYDARACIDAVRAGDVSECDFDPAAARTCAEEAGSAACVEDAALHTSALADPESCAVVHVCPDGSSPTGTPLSYPGLTDQSPA